MPEKEEPKQLTLQEAFGNVDKVCAQFKGTRADHIILQQSLQMIGMLVAQAAVDQPPEDTAEPDQKKEDTKGEE
jgi:hypothetical protein